VIVALRSHTLTQLLTIVLATTLACMIVRFVWVFISIYVGGRRPSREEAERGDAMEEAVLHCVGGASRRGLARDRARASTHPFTAARIFHRATSSSSSRLA